MDQVCIPIPMPDEDETLELAVTVGGTTRLVEYRIETVNWPPGASADERVDRLQSFIDRYEDGWTLVQIGSPGEGTVPITFRRRGEGSADPEPSG